MSRIRPVLAGVFLAAVQPAGPVRGEPPDSAAAQWLTGTLAATPKVAARTVTVTAALLPPAAEPGTPPWLMRPAWNEPLAGAYSSPHAARKEVGLAYSSDGRVSGYLAGRGAYRGNATAADTNAAPDLTSPPATYLDAQGAEPASVAALLGQLKTKGLKLRFDDDWKLDAGARSREYSSSALNSRVGHVTLQRHWGDLVTAYSFQVEKRGGWNVAPSQSLQLGYLLAPRSSLAVSYTSGHEIAFFGAQGMLKTEVRSVALHGEHATGKDWSLSFDAGYYEHGELPSHKAARVAFRRSF